MKMIADSSKLMFYCHDTYGLGHLRRTLTLAQYLCLHAPEMAQFIVTGSPVAQNFPFPEGVDYIKLPSVVKVRAGEYEARSMQMPFAEVRNMRREILRSAARHFRPDALIVDHAPAGLKGEILSTLRYLKAKSPQTRLVLGLRDIVDEAPRVRQSWMDEGIYDLLDNVYDLILVYGTQDMYDVVREYRLSPLAAEKIRYVGYLEREPSRRPPAQVRAEIQMERDRLVVVTAGGGGDGYELFRSVLEALRLRPDSRSFDCLLVGGPLMSQADRIGLLELASTGTAVHFLDFTEDMASYIGAADVVISMGGYNSVCEILSQGRSAIIVPRVTPRAEQLIRAEALARRGLVRMIHPNELTPEHMLAEVNRLLAEPIMPAVPLALHGLPAVHAELVQLLQNRPRPPKREASVRAIMMEAAV